MTSLAESPVESRVAAPAVLIPRPREIRTETKDLTVAIVNYRSQTLLDRCLRTWGLGTRGLKVELRVLENGTGDRLDAIVKRHVKDASIITHARSIAFSAAVNAALANPRGRHVALLNPDTLLGPDSLRRLVDHLDQNDDVGVVGPRVWDDEEKTTVQRSWRSFPGIATSLFNRYSLLSRVWPTNPWTRAYLRLDTSPDSVQDTDWLSGCCMVIRGDLFARLGGLDTGFPMFCEDVDLCRRTKDLGYRVVYDPRAEIVHFIGGSRRGAPLRSEWLRHRSMSHYVLKYRGRKNPFAWALVAGVWGRFAVKALRARSRT